MTSGLFRVSMDSGEMRPFEGGTGHVHVVDTSTGPVGRGVFNAGWRWSEHVKPIAGTASCEAAHMAHVISGRMTLTMDDGTSQQFGPGDLGIAPPGHDAVVDGDEPCVGSTGRAWRTTPNVDDDAAHLRPTVFRARPRPADSRAASQAPPPWSRRSAKASGRRLATPALSQLS